MLRKKKAQSTLEYIIIFSVVIVAVFVVAYSAFSPKVRDLVTKASDKVGNASATFASDLKTK